MATRLGNLQAASGALLVVFVDGARATQWPANEDRSLLARWETTETGLQTFVGDAGASSIWRVGEDLVLLEFFPDDDFEEESPEGRGQLAKRLEELPTRGKPKSRGFVQIESGCLAAMLPYADTSGVQRALRTGTKQLTSFHDHGVLIPLANGRYEILTENLGRTADGYEDESGCYVSRTRIRRVGDKAKPTAASTPAPGDVDMGGARAAWWGSMRGREPFELIALDAEDAPRYDGDGDFDRAFKLAGTKQRGGPMTTKAKAHGVVGALGLGLAITYWKLASGLGLMDVDDPSERLDLKSKRDRELLGTHFAQLPSSTSTRLGTVTVRSGALCVMRTMAAPNIASHPRRDTPAVLAVEGFEVGAVFPLANGVYEVHRDVLGDPEQGLMTAAGRIHVRVRFLRTDQPTPSSRQRIHLELGDGTTTKFWETWVEGTTLFTRFGRAGSAGQTKLKPFKTSDAASTERDALVAVKRKKGYT